MPIPDMPSVAKLYGPWQAPVLKDANVPCRLVPTFWGGRARDQGSDSLAWTHWVDFPREKNVKGNFQLGVDTSAGWNLAYAGADFFVICAASDIKVFLVLWVEDRYLDTEFQFKRAYVVGLRGNPNLVPFPCP